MIFKKTGILSLFLIMTAVFMLPFLAQALEIDYPALPGPGCPEGGCVPADSFGPSGWIRYIFVVSFALVSLVMVGNITYAGFKYLTAGDNAGQVGDAKKRIWSSFLGLVILLGSYLFLRTINPQLVNIRDPNINIQIEGVWRDYYKNEPPGTKEAGETCEIDLECASKKCSLNKCVASFSVPRGSQEQSSETLPANPDDNNPVDTTINQPRGSTPPQQ